MRRSTTSLLLITFVLTACSGGGGGAPSGVPLVSSPPVTPASGNRATLTLRVPRNKSAASSARRRAPAFVGIASAGVIVTATSTSGTAANDLSIGFNLKSPSLCTEMDSEAESCTLSLPLQPDTYSVQVRDYDVAEDGSPGAGSPSAPAGNLLSIDTENETVAFGKTNVFTNFLLHPEVKDFNYQAAPPVVIGAVGGTPVTLPNAIEFFAEDADEEGVDINGNAASYANGPFAVIETELGDITGCKANCTSGSNDNGKAPSPTPPVLNAEADNLFSVTYSGFGGPGAGVENWQPGSTPTGTQPYAASLTPITTAASQSAILAPLFAYPTSVTLQAPVAADSTSVAYVWAAQYAEPGGLSGPTGRYSGFFKTGPNSESANCYDSSNKVVATVDGGTYYPGYGEVYRVQGLAVATCTLTLSDENLSTSDSIDVPVTVTAQAPQSGCNTGGGSQGFRRRTALAPMEDEGTPTFVKSAVGQDLAQIPGGAAVGDTLVAIVGIEGGSLGTPTPGFTYDSAASFPGTYVYLKAATSPDDGAFAAGQNCNAAIFLGEFAGTSVGAIERANAAAAATGTATTQSIVPNAPGGLIVTAFESANDFPATASSGYERGFVQSQSPYGLLDIEFTTTGTTDTVDLIDNVFTTPTEEGITPTPIGTTTIFQIPPATFEEP